MRNVGKAFCCYLMARQYSEQDPVRWSEVQVKVGAFPLLSRQSLLQHLQLQGISRRNCMDPIPGRLSWLCSKAGAAQMSGSLDGLNWKLQKLVGNG